MRTASQGMWQPALHPRMLRMKLSTNTRVLSKPCGRGAAAICCTVKACGCDSHSHPHQPHNTTQKSSPAAHTLGQTVSPWVVLWCLLQQSSVPHRMPGYSLPLSLPLAPSAAASHSSVKFQQCTWRATVMTSHQLLCTARYAVAMSGADHCWCREASDLASEAEVALAWSQPYVFLHCAD